MPSGFTSESAILHPISEWFFISTTIAKRKPFFGMVLPLCVVPPVAGRGAWRDGRFQPPLKVTGNWQFCVLTVHGWLVGWLVVCLFVCLLLVVVLWLWLWLWLLLFGLFVLLSGSGYRHKMSIGSNAHVIRNAIVYRFCFNLIDPTMSISLPTRFLTLTPAFKSICMPSKPKTCHIFDVNCCVEPHSNADWICSKSPHRAIWKTARRTGWCACVCVRGWMGVFGFGLKYWYHPAVLLMWWMDCMVVVVEVVVYLRVCVMSFMTEKNQSRGDHRTCPSGRKSC